MTVTHPDLRRAVTAVREPKCEGCAWRRAGSERRFDRCDNPQNKCQTPSFLGLMFCDDVRDDPKLCGPEGRWALLRDPWPGCERLEMECVGEDYEVIE